jgi:amidohydrolase
MLSLIELRHDLHRHPELSGQEAATARRIAAFLRPYAPTELIEGLGGHGLAAVFAFAEPGPTVVIRCELDALPIQETNEVPYRSATDGVAHLCGHDGHMAMVAGLAPWLATAPLPRGRVVLLFQPAEETGQGARAVVEDPRFRALEPDYVFALHNLPGRPLGEVVRLDAGFSATVQSCAIRLTGQESHAAEPQHGRNPAPAIAQLIAACAEWEQPDVDREDFTLLTPIYAQLGQRAYGTAAGCGELHYTVRCWTDERMAALTRRLEKAVAACAEQHGLTHTIDWFEHFPATRNDPAANAIVSVAARRCGLPLVTQVHPFTFGEDFGWFTRHYPGAMFGLGSGAGTAALHAPGYDFPDGGLEKGVDLWREVLREVLE